MRPSNAALPFFGWRVVWAAFVLAVFGSGAGFYGPPVYLHAVVERTGWPVVLVSTAVTVHFIVGAFAVANLPMLYRRFGVPAITTAGASGLALGVLGWAIAAAPWQLFAATVLSGAGWAAMGGAAINAIVSPWFVRTRPAALATAYNGINIGGAVFSPLWASFIHDMQFAAAASLFGGVMTVVVCALSYWVFSKTPGELNQSPDGDAPGDAAPGIASGNARPVPGPALWGDRRFLTLAGGTALGLFAQIGLIAHLFSLLVPALTAQGAGLAVSLVTVCSIAGRTIATRIMQVDVDRRLVSCLSYAIQIAGSIVLIAAAGRHVALVLLGVVLFGLGIGNAISLPPLIAQVEFVKEDVQRVVALIIAIGQATYAFAPAAFALLRPTGTESDTTAFFFAMAITQLAAISCLVAGRRTGRRKAEG